MPRGVSARGYRDWRIGAQDGLRLAVRDYGDPASPHAPLLCLGGLARYAADFHELALKQAARRRVVALDYRGRGHSEWAGDARDYAAETLLSDVLQAMTATHLHRPVILGTSLGGSLAMAIAVVAPTRLAGAVLNDIGPAIDPGGIERIMGLVGRDWPQPDWNSATTLVERLMPGLGVCDKATWRRIAEATFLRGDDGQLHVAWDPRIVEPFRNGARRDLWPLFRGLRDFPVLALRGAQSDVLSPETLARMQAEKPDMTAVTVPGRGHAPLLDEPEAERAIDDFLARIDG